MSRNSKNKTELGRICYEAYARAPTGTARWDAAAAAVVAHVLNRHCAPVMAVNAISWKNPAPNAEVPMVPTSETVVVQIGGSHSTGAEKP